MSTGSPAGAPATAILSVCRCFFSRRGTWRRTFIVPGVPKKVDGLKMLKKGLNQHNLPQVDTLELQDCVGMAQCHLPLNMDGSLPENEPISKSLPKTPDLVKSNLLDPYTESRSQHHVAFVLFRTQVINGNHTLRPAIFRKICLQ